jgi:hypothetical protein
MPVGDWVPVAAAAVGAAGVLAGNAVNPFVTGDVSTCSGCATEDSRS